MASAKKWKRVAASQDGFLPVNASKNAADLYSNRKKRVSKNKKKNWNKHSDVQDVELFLDDVRLQERAVGGLLSEKADDSLFFVDLCNQEKTPQTEEQPPPVTGKRRRRNTRPLRIDMILKHDSLVPAPKDVLSHQKPNAKKLRRIAERIKYQAAHGKVSLRQRQLLTRRPVIRTAKKAGSLQTDSSKDPERDFFDIWGGEGEVKETEDKGDQWYLQQTCKKRVKRPDKTNAEPSVLPAVEVIAPGGSYNPDFFDHQALLKEAHEIEVKKEKVAAKLKKQLAVDRDSKATEESKFQEQVEGLVEEEAEEESEDEESPPVGAVSLAVKKTEKQRKKEKSLKFKAQRRKMAQQVSGRRQQLFQLRSLKVLVKQREQRTVERRAQRKSNEEAALSQPRRLGRQRFKPQDMEVQLSDELAGSLRRLKPEGSVLKDRFKSLQRRNLIEPRERAKFVRKHKIKYQEKRAFREITI